MTYESKAAEARRFEARAIMSLVNDAVEVALHDLEALAKVEDEAAKTEVPETFLGTLEKLRDANEQITESLRTIAVHLVSNRGVHRNRVAEAMGVTPMTVWRWVREQEEAKGGTSEE